MTDEPTERADSVVWIQLIGAADINPKVMIRTFNRHNNHQEVSIGELRIMLEGFQKYVEDKEIG